MAVWGLYFCIPLIWMYCLDFPAIPPRLFLYDLNTPLTVDEVIEKDIITSYDVEMSQMAKFPVPVFYHQTFKTFWHIRISTVETLSEI